MYQVIKNKGKMFLDVDKQLFIYIKIEGDVRKSRIINTIEIDFSLFGKRKKTVIFTFTDFAANDIDESSIHTIL